MTTGGLAVAEDAAATVSYARRAPAFDAAEFDELSEMIGQDGVMEMVDIFDTETRRRLLRLAARDQDIATVMREMHTLKGAAGTVAAPRLVALGRRFEQAAQRGIAPTRDELQEIESALEAWLAAARVWSATHAPAE